MSAYQYLFGPVPSRRLGRSLGVDLIPAKTCSLDCVFCQAGATSDLTLVRKEYVPLEAVLAEFDEWLRSGGTADAVTLAGAGEPTLHSRFGELITAVHDRCRMRVVLLSNGSLFHLEEVRAAARHADIVKVSISSWDQASFVRLHRPGPELEFGRMIGGITDFRASFRGEMWIEVFVVQGVNDDEKDMRKIAAIAASVRPDKIHLNTAVRPPAEALVHPVSRDVLEALAGLFTPRAEVVAGFKHDQGAGAPKGAEDLLGMIRRHPATAEEIAAVCGMSREQVVQLLQPLIRAGMCRIEKREGGSYYAPLAF